MRAIAIGEVVDVNRELERQGIAAKVHLHDACGRQTLSIETLDRDDGTLEAARKVIREFFEGRGMPVEFDPVEGLNFWAV